MDMLLIIMLVLALIFLGYGTFKPERFAAYIGYAALVAAAIIVLVGKFS